MPANQVTTYEIYLVDNGRWVLHARYRRDEREKALEEARTIERELNTQVKVTREVYSPSDNSSEETTIYATERGGVGRRAAGGGGGGAARGGGGFGSGGGGGGFGGGGGGGWSDADAPVRGGGRGGAVAARQAALQGTMGAMTRLVLIIAGSLVGAGIFTMMATMLIQRLPYWGVYIRFDLAPIQFMVFILGFLLIAVPLATKKVRWAGFSERQPRAKPAPRPAKPAKAKKPAVEAEPEAAEAPAEDAPAEAPPEDAAAEEATEETAEEAPAEEAEAPEGQGAGVAVEMQRESMSEFTGNLMIEVQKVRPQLDAYNRFGVSLMLAGAVDVVGERSNLEPDQRRTLLADTLQGIGTKADAAKSFSAKYEEYMTEKRYLGMIQAGRVAAQSYLDNPSDGLPQMKGLFDAWSKPQQQAATSRVIAVMFTDMVGSTDMTQVKGDQGAQVIVRRHNSIVRAALNEYGGKQIKHTGDGIMASFPSPGSGVEAAVAIQRAVAANNARFPDQSLHLRIGINAGEPIEEEEDLFGATVQLAARVCAAAAADQIMCTNVVKELSGGKGLSFVSRGPQTLKGFSDKVALYEVAWSG